MIFCIVFGAAFLVLGILFYVGKAMFLIPGWTQMTKQEKVEIRIVPLCKNVGSLIALSGIILLCGAAFPGFMETGLRWAMIGWLVLCVLNLLFISRSGRYTANPEKRR